MDAGLSTGAQRTKAAEDGAAEGTEKSAERKEQPGLTKLVGGGWRDHAGKSLVVSYQTQHMPVP